MRTFVPGTAFWAQNLYPAIQMSTGGIFRPPTAPMTFLPVFCAVLAARTPTRQPDSLAAYVRPITFLRPLNGASLAEESVIANWSFVYFCATVVVESASRKPAEMMRFECSRTA